MIYGEKKHFNLFPNKPTQQNKRINYKLFILNKKFLLYLSYILKNSLLK